MNPTLEHCLVVGPVMVGEQPCLTLQGETFDICLRQYVSGETSEGGLDGLGEEVATVVSGEFYIDAAGEQYTLTPGEGIIIPRNEPRRWKCNSTEGVLYRAIVRDGDTRQVTP